MTSLEEIDPNGEAYRRRMERGRQKHPGPDQVLHSRLSPTAAGPASKKAGPKFQKASATGPQLPMSTPMDEYLRLAGRSAGRLAGAHR